MSKRAKLAFLAGLLVASVVLGSGCKARVGHQRPYRWDAFALPELHFTNATIVEIVSTVNGAVAEASHGLVAQAVLLDTTPADIIVYTSDPALKEAADELMADFRKDETNWMNRGACGFETFRHTGKFIAGHSLGCEFQMLAELAGLNYEERTNVLYLGRQPARLECRPYKIGVALKQLAEDAARKSDVRVGFDPAVSAFVDVTRLHFWSIDVPEKPGSLVGETRQAKVFRYLPDKSVLLVLDTPEAHERAVGALKAKGIWEEL